MANDLPRVACWEMRPVPTADRGPIVEKTLDVLQESNIGLRVFHLDAMDLLALMRIADEQEEVCGLYWLAAPAVPNGQGTIVLSWLGEIGMKEMDEATDIIRNGIDDWARTRGLERVIYYTADGFKRARQAGAWIGFKPSPMRKFVREIPMEEAL